MFFRSDIRQMKSDIWSDNGYKYQLIFRQPFLEIIFVAL